MPLDPRLLLATEDLALSRTLSWVLKENGYDVITASGGPQLAERLDQEEYDLLVLDVAGGDAGALDRLSQLRNDPRTAELPLLVLADADVGPEALEPHGLGSADLVSRPYRVRELLARIKAHLRVGRELNRARAEARSRSEMVEILKEVTSALEPTRIYQILVRRVAQGLRIARCSVVLARPGDAEGTVVAAFENPTLRDLRVDLAKYPEIAEALRRGETVMVSDVDQHPLSRDLRASWALGAQPGGRTRSVIALPFALRGEPWGVFFLRTSEDDPPLNRIDLSFAEQVISAAVTALEKAYDLAEGQDAASLRALADTDPLTGLPNRRVLEQRLGEELDRARRYGQVLTVALVDLDHFKAINDEFGHQAGDAVLRQVATMLRRELRTNDLVARIGGEEFVLVLPETGAEGARLFVDRLLRRLGLHRFGPAEAPFWVTASVGLATFPDDRVADEDALLKLADENLYRAKHAGRNRYRD